MKRGAVFLAVAVFSVVATACGSGSARSVEAYCKTLSSEVEALESKYEAVFAQAENDPLGGLFIAMFATAEVTGDLAVVAEKLARVVPEEVQVEHETVAAARRDQAAGVGEFNDNMLEGLLGGLLGGAANNGAFSAVDEYSWEHCGIRLYG